MGAAGEEPTRDIPQMDAAARAELGALRVRAYGPAADIHDDPVAIARLEELERLARAETPPLSGGGGADPPSAGALSSASHGEPAEDGTASSPHREAGDDEPAPRTAEPLPPHAPVASARPTRLRTALLVGVASLVLVLGGVAAVTALQGAPVPEASEYQPRSYGLAADSTILMKLSLDAQSRSDDDPPDDDAPAFPVQGRVRWADRIGDYFGGELWTGGVASGAEMLCVVFVLGNGPQGHCEQRENWQRGALFLAVGYAYLRPEDRPVGLERDESLGFWWAPDDSVYIVRGPGQLIAGTAEEASAPLRFDAPADAVFLLEVPVDAPFQGYSPVPASALPYIPTLSDPRWARQVGEYYGFRVWLGAAEANGGDQLCIVIDGVTTRYLKSTCGPRDGWEQDGLYVSVPYTQIEPAERPNALAEGDRVGFWWTPDDAVRVLGGGSRPESASG